MRLQWGSLLKQAPTLTCWETAWASFWVALKGRTSVPRTEGRGTKWKATRYINCWDKHNASHGLLLSTTPVRSVRHQLSPPSWHISKTSEAARDPSSLAPYLPSNLSQDSFKSISTPPLKPPGPGKEAIQPTATWGKWPTHSPWSVHHTSLLGVVQKSGQGVSGGDVPGLLACEWLSYWCTTPSTFAQDTVSSCDGNGHEKKT